MRRVIATACVLAMMSCGVWAQQSSPQTPPMQKAEAATKKPVAKKAPKTKKALVKKSAASSSPAKNLPAQIMPPVPATLMNSEPVMPTVTMANGMLTIDAPNSILSDVLDEIQKATGATIEGASPTERVAVKLGPGNPEKVIAALLHGTPYDYVILGSLDHRDVVTRVLLTPPPSGDGKSSGEAQPAKGASPISARSPQGFGPRPGNTPPPSDDQAEQPESEPEPTPEAQPNPPKSPDQLLKELQQLDQQRQQTK